MCGLKGHKTRLFVWIKNGVFYAELRNIKKDIDVISSYKEEDGPVLNDGTPGSYIELINFNKKIINIDGVDVIYYVANKDKINVDDVKNFIIERQLLNTLTL